MKRLLLLALPLLGNTPAPPDAIDWQPLAQGLQLGELSPAQKSDLGDSKITILKIDPRCYAFRLRETVRYKGQRRTAALWCQQEKLVACINAGMYQPDGHNVGYMRNFGQVNNPVFGADNALLAFNPVDSADAPIKVIDRSCEADWEQQARRYQSVSQSIRMLDCAGHNAWAPQPRKWSAALWGQDKDGQALMIFCRSPYTMHDLTDILLQSSLGLRQLMYLEGGPEASLYLRVGHTERNLFGSHETGFVENDDVHEAFPLPNVIGIVRK